MNTKPLQETIKKVLSEELKDSLTDLIKTDGIERALKTVGGFKRLAKILELDLDDIDTQEMLVKNFIYHTKIDQIDVLFIEVRSSGSGGKILTVNLKTDDTASNVTSWYVHEICNYFNGRQDSPEVNKKLFPFKVKPAWHPVFGKDGCKIFLNAEIVNDEEDEDLMESKQKGPREIPNEYRENVRVKISDIQPTNRDGQSIEDAIINVKDGLTSYSQDPPFLLKRGDKYEILDGFHRIAQKILDGKKYVTSDVMIKESIRKVLKEETNYTRMLLRRLPTDISNNIDNLFNSLLNYISKMFIKIYTSDPRKLSEHEFTRMVIIDFMSLLNVRNHLPNDVEWYDDLLNSLSKHYKKRITSMYNVLKK